MLTAKATMIGSIRAAVEVSGVIEPKAAITGSIRTGMSDTRLYDGDYDIIPEVGEAIIVPCKDKKMRDNLTVEQIPITHTSNITGTTITIGG